MRRFEPRPVEPEKLEEVLAAVNGAPSAGDLQAFEVVCATRQEVRKALSDAALKQAYIAEAPVTLVFFTHPLRSSGVYGLRGADLYCVQDATIACAFAHLRAADLGLGSVWVGAFDEKAVSQAVNAPDGLRPVALLPIGYPAETPGPTPRRGINAIVRRENF